MNSEFNFDEVIARAKAAFNITDDGTFAEAIGMTRTAFSNRRTKGSLPFDKLVAAINSRNVDLKWVLTGSVDTSVLRDATFAATEVALKFSAVGSELLHEMQTTAFTEKLDAEQLQERYRERLPASLDFQHLPGDYQFVPRSSARPSAGHGTVVDSDQIVDYLAFKREWLRRVLSITHNDLVVVEVRGDSMAGTLDDGDLVLIDMRQNRLDVSAVFVLQIGDALLVKRVQRKLDGTVIIKSDNPAYDPEVLQGEQLEALKIFGRVVWPRLR